MGLRVLIVALLLIITAIILIAAFTGFFRQETSEVDKYVKSLGDGDEDGVVNMFDKCCCTAPGQIDLVDSKGCAPEENPKKCKDC